MESYDLLIIGGGPGGTAAAIKSARLGLKTAIVENREFGGACLNRGCIPTKSLLHAAKCYEEIKASADLGLNVAGLGFDFPRIHQRKNTVVEKLRNGLTQMLKSNKIKAYQETGAITGPHLVRMKESGEEITAENILIATGAEPAFPPIPGLDLPNVMNSDGFLSLEDALLPNVAIIGGGVIGVEFATILNALGSQVTIIEAMDRILPTMDKDIAQNLAMLLKKRGVVIHTGAMVERIREENGLTYHFEKKGQQETGIAAGIIVAIGRKAHTASLFGENFSVAMDRGFIIIDENCRTNVDGIYAIGDVAKGSIQLAHYASAMGIFAVEKIVGCPPSVDLSVVPGCVYTSPEIATVGMTAEEAKAKGYSVKTGKSLMSANGKSVVEQEDRGFVKVVFDADNGRLLGAQIMCARATDMIAEMTTAIVHSLTAEELAAVVRPHPTFCEAVTEAVENAIGKEIHSLRKETPAGTK